MKKIACVLALVVGLSYIASAKDSYGITPDVENTTQETKTPVKKQVKKVIKKKRVLKKGSAVNKDAKPVTEEINSPVKKYVRKIAKNKKASGNMKVQKTRTKPLNNVPSKLVRKPSKPGKQKKPAISEQKSIKISVRSMFVDKYVIPSGMVSYGKPVIQSDVLVSFKSGLYLDVWNSTQLKKKSVGKVDVQSPEMEANPGYELEYNIGWNGPLIAGINLDVGVIYCDLLKYGKIGASEDVLYNYVKLSHIAVAGFSAQVIVENYTMMKNSVYPGGNLYVIGVTRGDVLAGVFNLDTSLEAVYDTGIYGYESGEILRGKVGLSAKVYKSLTGLLQVNHYEPLNVREGYASKTTISSGLSYQF